MNDDDGGFVIFSGNKLWYSSKEGMENTLCKNKVTKVSSKVRNSAKNKRVVEFPFFDQLMKLETDPYWISFFDEAATGKLPRNFRYYNNIINYRAKTKNIEVCLPEDLLEASKVIKLFVLENAGIISPTDLLNKQMEEERYISEMGDIEITSWNQIRSDKQQNIIISIFVDNIGEYYNLNTDERRILIQNIKIGILAGYVNSENIEFDNNQIIRIDGLEYDPENREFSFNMDVCKFSKVRKNIPNEPTMDFSSSYTESNIDVQNRKSFIKQWYRYVSDMNKKFK